MNSLTNLNHLKPNIQHCQTYTLLKENSVPSNVSLFTHLQPIIRTRTDFQLFFSVGCYVGQYSAVTPPSMQRTRKRKINGTVASMGSSGICQLKKPPANKYQNPQHSSIQTEASQDSNTVTVTLLRCTRFRAVVNNNGQTRRKAMSNKQKENEEQLLNHDCKESLLMDMKSKMDSI